MQPVVGSAVFVIVASAILFVTMWSAGQFVGQKSPHLFAKWAVLLLVSLGVLYGVLHGARLEDFHTPVGLLAMGWVAGSVLSAIVAVQELQGHSKASSLE